MQGMKYENEILVVEVEILHHFYFYNNEGYAIGSIKIQNFFQINFSHL